MEKVCYQSGTIERRKVEIDQDIYRGNWH